MKLFAACAGAVAVLGLSSVAASAQTIRGSSLENAQNVPWGCELAPDTDLTGSVLAPHGFPSCSWWSLGSSGAVADPRTTAVPSTGTVTNVSIRSGANPAPIRIVILRSTNGKCCEGIRATDVLQPTPNAVSTFTVNLPVESVLAAVPGGNGALQWLDYVGVSAASGTGTLPIHDQAAEFGPSAHTPEAALDPRINLSAMTAPELLPTDGIRLGGRAGPGYELLLRYEHVPCRTDQQGRPIARAAQAGGCAQPPAGGPPVTGPSDGLQPPPPPPPAAIGSGTLRLRGNRLVVPLTCALQVPCRGVLRVTTRARRPQVLARANVNVLFGAAFNARPKLSAAGRKSLAARRRVPARAVLDLGTGGVVTRDVILKR